MAESDEPLTPLEESTSHGSIMRESIITYSSDVIDSSMAEVRTIDTTSTKRRRSVNRDIGPPFYKKRRFWGIYIAVNVLLLAISLPLFFFVIFPAIAQKVINSSNLELNNINITNPNQDSFILSSSGLVSNGGPFNSKLSFKAPVTMYWSDKELGTVQFDDINVKGGQAEIILQNKEFIITNRENIINFSKDMMTGETIEMTFKGSVSVKAMGIERGGLTLKKTVTLAGVSNFSSSDSGGPKILGFNITQPNDFALGINITVRINNPSVFSMTLGTVGIAASYNGTKLSDLIVPDFNLVPGPIDLNMFGNITPPTTLEDLVNFETFMSSYLSNTPINTTSTVLYSHPDHVNDVEWLTSSLSGTQLVAELGSSPNGPPKLITGLDFGGISLNFTKENPFIPLLSSNNSVVQYKSPFDIKMKMLEASQNITLYSNDTPVATVITDFFPVSDNGLGNLTFNIPPVALNGSSDEFAAFVKDLTLLPQVTVNVTGLVGIVTEILIGNLTLKGIPFTINSTLDGFSGFSTATPEVKNVSLVGGTNDYLIVQITTTLTNPTKVSLAAGDVSFQILYNNNIVGIANTTLSLAPGPNNLLINSYLDPTHNPNAQEVLTNFMKNQTTNVTLHGYDGSTDIESLKLAMSSVGIAAPLPGLSSKMITDASLKVLDTTTTNANVTSAVSLSNPFVASITILNIDSNVTSQGYYLGRISQDRSNDPIVLPGNGKVTVSDLPFSINLDPVTMFGLLRSQAQLANLDTSVIDALITIGKIPVPGVPQGVTIDPKKFENFDIKAYVETALANIVSEITLLSTVKVGDYVMPFAYSQNVTAHTDSSITKLIPILSRPIVQTLVDASVMNFQKLLIEKPTEESFVTLIVGQISNTGPLPATISFPNGASLISDNATLGTMSLPPITAQDNHADLNNVQSNFKILNKDALAAFTTKVLLSDSVSWTITADNLTVSALKIDVPGISMQKVVELKGGSGFKGAVIINNYTLPGDAPEGGISTVIDSTLTNPSTVGVELGTVKFDVFSDNVKIGEASSSGLTIEPAGPTKIKLIGRLIPQTGEGLKVMAKIFAEVLAGQPVPVTTKPTGFQPSISWLVTAMSQLSFDTTLPPINLGKIIPSVKIDEMTMSFTPDTAFNPITSSKGIEAQMKIPFGFTLIVKELSEEITLINENTNMAKLSIPQGPAKTVNKTTIIGSYENIPLLVFNEAHDSFKSFVKDLTIGDSKTFALSGNASALANTPIGEIPMNNIPIDVQTSLDGLKGFNDKPIIINSIDVTSGTPKVLTAPITTSLFNPSVITISVGDVSFDLVVNKTTLGTVIMKDFKVVPGNNNISAQVLFSPSTLDASFVGVQLFEKFLMNQTQTTGITGSQKSTDVESLKDAMSALTISAELPGLGKQLLLSSYITFDPSTLLTGKAHGGFTIRNPFTATLTISTIRLANITFHGRKLALIEGAESETVVPGKSTVKSKPIEITVFLAPSNLVPIIKLAAADAKIDITPLLPLLRLLDPTQPPSHQKRNVDITTRDVTPVELLIEILRSIHADVQMSIISKMDQYELPLSLTLKNIPNEFDDSLNTLVQAMSSQITQLIISKSIITVDTVLISGEQADNFNLHLKGFLSSTGNVKATISFNSGLNVTSSGKELGIAKMPPIKTDGSDKSPIDSDSKFQITSIPNFAEFTGALMLQKSVNWTLNSKDVQVEAFGETLKNLTLNTPVSLLGFDGLKDVKVTKFNLTKTQKGTLGMLIDTDLTNPSNAGIDLGTIVFNVFSGDLLIGPITATKVILAPKSVNKIHFDGEIVITDPKKLLELMADIESGKAKTTAKGVSVKPPGATGDIPWLSGPFTHLTLSVPLPKGSFPNPISTITIEDLEVSFTPETAYNPISSSKKVLTTISIPVDFPLVSASQSITIVDGDKKVASLDIPDSPIISKDGTITSSISNIPLKALDNGAFESFMFQLTASASKTFKLIGSVTAKTKDETLPPIEFNVSTSLKGLQGFKSAPVKLSNINIIGASAEGVSISLDVTLTNPSTVQVGVGDVTFDIKYSGQTMGSTTIKNLIVVPGSQNYKADFLFAPKTEDAAKAGADLLGNFLTSKDSPLLILGNKESTQIASLKPTFQLLSLGTTLNGLPVKVIESMTITGNKKTGTASMIIDNQLNIGYLITGIVAKLSLDGKEIGTINLPKSPFPISIKPKSKQPAIGIPVEFTGDVQSGKGIKLNIDASVFVDINKFIGTVHLTEEVTTDITITTK